MSAVAVSYDPGFSMGTRTSFTWPVMEPGSGLLPPEFGSYGSDASFTPPSGSRSATASPPRSTLLTPEQRELKRQRDQARHSSKLQARGRRADSASSASVHSTSTPLVDMTTGASNMPVYTTAPSQVSLLTEPSGPQYLPQYSPQLPDHTQANMFTSPYPPQSYIPDYGYPSTAAPSLPSQYGYVTSQKLPDPNLGLYPVPPPIMGPGSHDAGSQVRVVHSRPKPQCWDHGCNGRQFSTFSNLLRHQREKSGQATKAICPNCGAEFTRTTARNGHLLHDKCKKKNNNSN
ncbi:hypothetical protein VTK56DRAFT_8057 [Thermocarpiscus australiensis]